MNRIAGLAVLAAALGTIAGQAQAPSAGVKVGVVNSQKAMLDTAEIKKAQLELETKYKPRQEQMAQLQKDISVLQAQIQSGKLTPIAQQEVTTQGQRKERDLQRLQDDLQADVDRDRNDILGRVSQRMRDIVSKIANEKGLDLVIDAANAIFFKPAMDLTAEATADYDKSFPATAASK
jgi:outer membrane protein